MSNRGAPQGNTNAVKHGAFSRVIKFTDAERRILKQSAEDFNPEEALIEEISLLTIRERRLLKLEQQVSSSEFQTSSKITNYRLTKDNGDDLPGYPYQLTVEQENSILLFLRIEDALTRVQDQKRKMVRDLTKLRNPMDPTINLVNEWVMAVFETAEAEENQTP